ncbi:MAG: AMP-binding protein, partial [Chromatiaceae bacterium]|nr:AMP-binding protein [Chromatiaceae bacterium]
MSEHKVYEVPESIAAKTHVNAEQYAELYRRSIEDPEGFWAEQAEQYVSWFKPWTKVMDYSYQADDLHVKWFDGARLNVSYNCLDRHLATRGDQTAIIWEGDNPAEDRKISYRELHAEVCRLANVLKSRGVEKGDRVCIYLPMIPEAAVAMLACTRIGAVHSIVFGGFSPDSLRDRVLDSECKVVITSDESVRGGRHIPLKKNADVALQECPNVETMIVVRRTGGHVDWVEGRDIWYHEAIDSA